jgi:hypothetical protein
VHEAKKLALLLVAGLISGTVQAQTETPTPPPPAEPAAPPAAVTAPKAEPEKKPELHWYEKFRIRGYTQLRYNRIAPKNDAFVNIQGDRSLSPDNSFFLRRARLIIFGEMNPHLAIYLQPDFASVINEQLGVAILRDWYADIFLDKAQTFRFRVGQSKVPFGFENMQSSQNRMPFDRSDALNSAVKDERDLGIFFYWASVTARRRFKMLVDDGLKGSGDYGVFAFGAYNGQTANRPEMNGNVHMVTRLTYPFELGSQMVEMSVGGYTGVYTVKKDSGVTGPDNFRDQRAHVSFVLYPKPFGLQAEYNVGTGPQRVRNAVEEHFLQGGYVLASLKMGSVIPYARYVHYNGGKKFENNAAPYHVREVEGGIEWGVAKWLELTGAVLLGHRSSPNAPYDIETGRRFRLQLQFNY